MTESGGKIQTRNKAEIYGRQVTLSVLSNKIRLITETVQSTKQKNTKKSNILQIFTNEKTGIIEK